MTDQTVQAPDAAFVAAMLAAQDAAARQYWAYPSHGWQSSFQHTWLVAHGYRAKVEVDGVTYGRAQDEAEA